MQSYMFAIELVSLVSSAIGLMYLKSYLPDMFFPASDVQIYLPPRTEDLVQKKGQKTQLQMRQLSADSKSFLQVPFTSEIETTVMFGYILMFHFVLVQLLEQFFGLKDSGVVFYLSLITLSMLVSNMFKAATIGGLQGHETKMAILVSMLCTVMILVLFFGFKDFVDIDIRHELERQQVHLQVIFQGVLNLGWLSDLFILLLALLISFVMFSFVPVIIRFGNCWTEFKNPIPNESPTEAPKYTFQILTFQLLIPLFIICLNLKPFTKSLPNSVQPIFLQTGLLAALVALQAFTYRTEMNRHMVKALQWSRILIDNPEHLVAVQKKVQGLFKGMVVVSYQLLAKIVIPLLLLMIMIQRSDKAQGLRHRQLPGNYAIQDFYCLEPEYTVLDYIKGISDQCHYEEPEDGFVSKILTRRIQTYGLVSRTFIYTVVQFCFFNYMFLMFVLKIFYIFFVNKTQTVNYEKQKKKI